MKPNYVRHDPEELCIAARRTWNKETNECENKLTNSSGTFPSPAPGPVPTPGPIVLTPEEVCIAAGKIWDADN